MPQRIFKHFTQMEDFGNAIYRYGESLYSVVASPFILFVGPVTFLLRLSANQEFYMSALVFAYLADSLLGPLEAIANKNFKWSRFLGMLYKAMAYFLYLKLAQFAGDLLERKGVSDGENIMVFFIVVMFVNEAKSAIVKADRLYPNAITRPLVNLLNRISANNDEPLNPTKP